MKKQKIHPPHFFNFLLLLLFLNPLCSAETSISQNGPLSDSEAHYIKQRQLLYYRDDFVDRGEKVIIDPSLIFENPRIRNAYIALQAWKQAILSDPLNLTSNWVGSNVCNYTGIFCAPAIDNPKILTVTGIDLNHGDIAGYLPEELGLLTDLGIFHINSNRFCGTVPKKFKNLRILFEFDISNNRFAGKFPYVVLSLPKYLTVLDLSFNELMGVLPESIGGMESLEQLNVGNNLLRGKIPESICGLPRLENFTYSYNFFTGEPPVCLGLPAFDDRRNCLPKRPSQRSAGQCKAFLSKKVLCGGFRCRPGRHL